MTLDIQDLVERLESPENDKRSTVDKVVYEIRRLGLDMEEPPTTKSGKPYSPRLPYAGVTSLTNKELGNLQGEFVTMMEYVGEQATLYDITARDYQRRIKRTISSIKLKIEGTAAEREDRARTHRKVVRLEDAYEVARGAAKILENKHQSYHEKARACSRDVERRIREFDDSLRSASIKSKSRVTHKRGPIPQHKLEVE